MTIYFVKHDTRYPFLGFLKESDGYKMPRFYGQPVTNLWTNPTVDLRIEEDMEMEGNFPYLLSSGILACSGKAWSFLKPLIAHNVEAFQLMCDEGEFYALNILDVIDCLVYSHSHIE